MKRVLLIISGAVIIIGAAVGGGYYWHKKQNEPPKVVVYKDIAEVDSDIARLEPLDKAGKLRWQDKYQLGVAYIQKGRVEDAARTLEDVIKIHQDFYKTYESLGMAYHRMEEFEKAQAAWEKALQMSPQSAHLEDMINRAKKRIEIKKRIATLEQETRQNQADWQKRLELAVLYMTMRRTSDAIALLEEVMKIKKDSYEVYDAVAQGYAMSGDFDKAIDAEKKAAKLKPGDENLKKRIEEMERIREGLKTGEYHKKQ